MIPGKCQPEDVQQAFVDKMLRTVACAQESDGKEVVLSFDPMHQIHNNENGYAWQIRGKDGTKKVLSNTGRRRLNILGALDMVSKDIVPLITEVNCNKEVIKVFLNEVSKAYPRAEKITLFLDNATYQRNYEVQEHAERLGITLEFMPPYSPNLCLIERLWKFFKKKIMKNTYYETFDEFYDSVCDFFRKWDMYKKEIETLMTLNFEIIKAS